MTARASERVTSVAIVAALASLAVAMVAFAWPDRTPGAIPDDELLARLATAATLRNDRHADDRFDTVVEEIVRAAPYGVPPGVLDALARVRLARAFERSIHAHTPDTEAAVAEGLADARSVIAAQSTSGRIGPQPGTSRATLVAIHILLATLCCGIALIADRSSRSARRTERRSIADTLGLAHTHVDDGKLADSVLLFTLSSFPAPVAPIEREALPKAGSNEPQRPHAPAESSARSTVPGAPAGQLVRRVTTPDAPSD